MPDFAGDQRDKAQLPRLPWLVKNQELSAVPVKLNKLQPGWSEGVIQCVPQFSLSSGTACYPTWIQIHILGQALSPEHHRQGSRIWWQQYFPQGQIFTGLDGTVIWIPAPKLQTWAAWTRSHHLTNPPDRFYFQWGIFRELLFKHHNSFESLRGTDGFLGLPFLQGVNQAPARKRT